MIPLFDSLAHPTLTGTWPARVRDATVETLLSDMATSGFAAACAVGLAGLANYEHKRFAELCLPYANLIPVAGIDPLRSHDIKAELAIVRDLGYRAIKMHPRLAGFDFRHPKFAETLTQAFLCELPVFLCTYFHSPVSTYPINDPLFDLVQTLKQVPAVRLLLIHGGDVELMRYVQLARHNPNILIDLSYTMMKYQGSSIDMDIQYLCRNYSKRICIGVDHPEFTHHDVRARFEEFTANLDDKSAHHVAHLNLGRFLGVQTDDW